MAQIICFGDSIAYGTVDDNGGWVQRARNHLDETRVRTYNNNISSPIYDVYGLGVSGETSKGLLTRMESEIQPRLLFGRDTVIVIAIGTNDSVYRTEDDSVESTEADFSDNLKQLIEIARIYTQNILLVGLLPCNEKLMQPMPWSTTGRCYSNERLAMFNDVIVQVADSSQLPVINLFDTFAQRDTDEYLADGIHPNSVGHQAIADSVIEKLEDIL